MREGDLGVPDGEPALRVPSRKAAAGISVDGPGQTLDHDQQADGHDHRVEFGPSLQRTNQHPLNQASEHEPENQHGHEGPPIAETLVEEA
jgi:hypothetical protein